MAVREYRALHLSGSELTDMVARLIKDGTPLDEIEAEEMGNRFSGGEPRKFKLEIDTVELIDKVTLHGIDGLTRSGVMVIIGELVTIQVVE